MPRLVLYVTDEQNAQLTKSRKNPELRDVLVDAVGSADLGVNIEGLEQFKLLQVQEAANKVIAAGKVARGEVLVPQLLVQQLMAALDSLKGVQANESAVENQE